MDETITIGVIGLGNAGAPILNNLYQSDSKYELVEANVTHDGTNAYIATFGSVTNYAPDGSSTTTLSPTFAADINGSNVRILVTNPTADSMVFRFQRVTIDA